MATKADTISFILDQLEPLRGAVTSKKMFGEYALYLNEKVVGFVCDDQLFLKPTKEARALLSKVTEGAPYPGAKPYLLISDELEDPRALAELITTTANALPAAKLKKPKAKPSLKSQTSRD